MLRRRRGTDEATHWIGYTDFLTTLLIIFFVLMVAAFRQSKEGTAWLAGEVRDLATGRSIAACPVKLGADLQTRTDSLGRFEFSLPELSGTQEVWVSARCPGYGAETDTVSMSGGELTRHVLLLNPDRSPVADPLADNEVREFVLSGDAFFDKDSATLSPEGVRKVIEHGKSFKDALRPGEILAIQGHTDDQQFESDASVTNMILSGQRAGHAARILTDPEYGIAIPECLVITMGFGASRPLHRFDQDDNDDSVRWKRSRNRRIEFRKLQGPAVAKGGCE